MLIRRLPAAWASFGCCVVGLLIAAYLTVEHYTDNATLACSDSGLVNCAKVTTSQWSVLLGIPVAVGGLAYFVVMVALCLPVQANARTAPLRLIGVVAGVAAVLYLVYVELFRVDALCLWCTGIHLIVLVLLGTVLWWRESQRVSH